MYLSFAQIFARYNPVKKIKGIIHIGACTGEERHDYQAAGIDHVLWYEANPETFDILKENIASFSGHVALNETLWDIEDKDLEFHITSNYRAASSSILELQEHKKHHPDIHVVKTIGVRTTTLQASLNKHGLDTSQYNFLNLDIQGAELHALKGASYLLSKFDYIYSEVNRDHLYKNCCLLPELEDYLKAFGFQLRQLQMTPYDWGDALFVKKDIWK